MTENDDQTQRTGADRRFRVVPFVLGLTFLVIGVSAIVADVDELDADIAWLWVVAFATLGVGGLVATLGAARR